MMMVLGTVTVFRKRLVNTKGSLLTWGFGDNAYGDGDGDGSSSFKS